jgi:hypothetical protein
MGKIPDCIIGWGGLEQAGRHRSILPNSRAKQP